MKHTYINKFDKETATAEMFIYKEISNEGVNGAYFAEEMRWLAENGVKTIKIKFNSVGGDVIHAQSIVSEIIDAPKKGVVVEGYLNGLGASSAGVIWLSIEAKNRFAKDYARLMIHGVSFKDDSNVSENDKNSLNQFKSTLIQILTNRTSKKETFFENLFSNGLDNWFNTKEMVKAGFLLTENVENTNVKVNISEKEKTAGVAVVYNILNSTVNENINKNTIKMKNVIARLKLQEGVSEEVIEKAVETIQNSLTTAVKLTGTQASKITELENKIAEQKTLIESNNKTATVAFVENCIKEGKIDPAKKEEVIASAENNLQGFMILMNAIPAKPADIRNAFKDDTVTGTPAPAETRSFRQLEREAPQVLNALKANDKPAFVALYNAEYKTNKTEADF
jgi:ATP-dependent protease ClpP protease subunit